MKWDITLSIIGIIILTFLLFASFALLPRALRYKRAKRPTETEEDLAVNRLIRKFQGLHEQLPTEYRFSGDAKDLAAVQGAVRSLESLQAEVKAQRKRCATPAAVESLDRLLVAIGDARGPLKETEIVNRHMRTLQRVARAMRDSNSGAQVKGREAIAAPVDVLRSVQQEMELDRLSFRESQTKNAMDRLIGQVQGFLAGVEGTEPRETASSEREELRARAEESAAHILPASGGAAFSGRQEENLIDFAEFVLQRYAWALDATQVSLLTSLAYEAKRALRDPRWAGLMRLT